MHAIAFLHNEVGTFTDEWPQEWCMLSLVLRREAEWKTERERIELVVPPSRVDAFPHDSPLALCSHTEVTQHQTRIFKGTGREMFIRKIFLPCIERKDFPTVYWAKITFWNANLIMVCLKLIYQRGCISSIGTRDLKIKKDILFVHCTLAWASLDVHVVALLSAVHSDVDPAATAVAFDTSAFCI